MFPCEMIRNIEKQLQTEVTAIAEIFRDSLKKISVLESSLKSKPTRKES